MLTIPPNGNKMEAVFSSLHSLTKDVQEMTDGTDANCITRSAMLIHLANQDYTAELTDAGIKADLGFIFQLTTNPGANRPLFHVSNYLIARYVETPDVTDVIEADAYFGSTRPIINKKLRELLTGAENPSTSIIYYQIDFDTGERLLEQADTLRPAPFRLKKQANREVYLGEEIGYEALSELADNSDFGKDVDKSKLPVLLLR